MPVPTWFCATCGSEAICHDAIVHFDTEVDDYVVDDVLDNMWCTDCSDADRGDGKPMWGIPPDDNEDLTDEPRT